MTAGDYEKILGGLRAKPRLCRAVQLLTRGLPVLFMAAYCAVSGILLLRLDERAVRFLTVPALTLRSCMALRRIIDRPRPYEVFGFQPLISRDKKGRSCPSNHTASAVIIALAFLSLSPAGGWMLLPAVLVAVSRVCCGVHWPGDVLAGAALAMAIGIPGFWII